MNQLLGIIIRHGLAIFAGVMGAKYGIEIEPQTVDAVAAGIAGAASVALSVREKQKRK